MGHIRFFAICGNTSGCSSQCISAEYYFHHRPSFSVESNIIFVTTFYKIKKCILRGSSKLYSNHPFRNSSLKLGCTISKFTIKKLPLTTELLQTCIKSVLFFKNQFGNILKKMGWGRFAHAFMGHIRACLFNVLDYLYRLYLGTNRAQEVNHREKRFIKHNCKLGIQ